MEGIVVFKAIILGIVEGVTEFLPVSSTGHLILFGDYLEFDAVPAQVFEITIQLGAILAIYAVYRIRLTRVAFNFYKESKSRNFVVNLLIAFMPSVVVGLMLHGFITGVLFNVKVVAVSLILGGIVMVFLDRFKIEEKFSDVDDLNKKTAFKIGLFQLIAMIPGVSRSGATIIGGMFSGLSIKSAAEFSFFLALPTMAGATFLDIYKNYELIEVAHLKIILIGFITAFISGWIVVVTFIEVLSKIGFKPFGYYRIVLGALILLF